MEAIGIAFGLEDGSETIPPCCSFALSYSVTHKFSPPLTGATFAAN